MWYVRYVRSMRKADRSPWGGNDGLVYCTFHFGFRSFRFFLLGENVEF